MGTKVLRYQNQELIHYDQVLKGEAVTLYNKEGVKLEKKKIVPQEGGIYSNQIESLVEDSVDISEYSCSPTCRHLVGRIWEGVECPICHQVVKNNYAVSFDRNGWINLAKIGAAMGREGIKITGKLMPFFEQMSDDTSYIKMFMSMAKMEKPNTPSDVPTYILVPSYILHELTVAFKIGVLLYIPFIIIDMVVASILMAMGMMMLPPVQISMPFKLILFVLVDGWGLLTQQLFNSVIR